MGTGVGFAFFRTGTGVGGSGTLSSSGTSSTVASLEIGGTWGVGSSVKSASQEGFQKDGMADSSSGLGFGGGGWGFGTSKVFGGEDASFHESEDLD